MVMCCFCSEPLDPKSLPSSGAILLACSHCFNPIVLSTENGTPRAESPRLWHDLRTAAPEESIGRQILKICLESMDQLPVLPAIAHRITELIRDPNSVIADIASLIQSDPVIAMRVLRVANSPIYAGLSEVKDLQSACVRLGMKTVAGIVHAIGNGRLYVTKDPRFQAMMQTLWKHALATAYCTGELALLLAQPHKDVFFVAGLIHDIGKVVLLDVVSNVLHNQNIPAVKALRESEKVLSEVMDVYHPLIGLHLIQHWNLPMDFRVSVFGHEHPDAMPSESWNVLNHAVILASAIATVSGYGLESEKQDISLMSLPSTKFLGLTDIKIAALRVNLDDHVQALLNIASEK